MNLFDKTPIGQVLNNVKKLNADQIFVDVFNGKEVQRLIIKLNTEGQLLEKGVNALGEKLSDIGGKYSPVTMEISREKGRPKKSPDHVDLHDAGEFHRSFRIERVTSRGFEINSDPFKDDVNLLEEWGEEVEGLTFESLEELRAFVLNIYQQKVWKKLMKVG